ncbi:MAG: hypothetical protein AVDCRST_MAG49-1221, partial [uncultured Thermomicrobiales bacterium]
DRSTAASLPGARRCTAGAPTGAASASQPRWDRASRPRRRGGDQL